MKLVLDASAAIALGQERTGSDAIQAALLEADEVLAPDLFVADVSNAVWKWLEFSGMSEDTADALLERVLSLVETLVPGRELYRAALMLSHQTHRPVYDSFYLALARQEGARLVTLDKALIKTARRYGIGAL